MAELTHLDEKLAEVLGIAQAAAAAGFEVALCGRDATSATAGLERLRAALR